MEPWDLPRCCPNPQPPTNPPPTHTLAGFQPASQLTGLVSLWGVSEKLDARPPMLICLLQLQLVLLTTVPLLTTVLSPKLTLPGQNKSGVLLYKL